MDKQLAQLETVLLAMIQAHESLLEHLAAKQRALSAADHEQVATCCRLENVQIQAIAALEKKRMELAAQLTLMVEPEAQAPMRLDALAQHLPEPARGRLLVLRQQLRSLMEKVQRDSGVIRRASDALLRHMQGLVQSVGAGLTGVNTYSRRGAPPAAATAVSTFCTTA